MNTQPPIGPDGDRLFWTCRQGLVSRATFVALLRQWAKEWQDIASGAFYGLRREHPDTEAIEQSKRILKQASDIEREGKNLLKVKIRNE